MKNTSDVDPQSLMNPDQVRIQSSPGTLTASFLRQTSFRTDCRCKHPTWKHCSISIKDKRDWEEENWKVEAGSQYIYYLPACFPWLLCFSLRIQPCMKFVFIFWYRIHLKCHSYTKKWFCQMYHGATSGSLASECFSVLDWEGRLLKLFTSNLCGFLSAGLKTVWLVENCWISLESLAGIPCSLIVPWKMLLPVDV